MSPLINPSVPTHQGPFCSGAPLKFTVIVTGAVLTSKVTPDRPPGGTTKRSATVTSASGSCVSQVSGVPATKCALTR